jgi:hypothetical protein
VHIKVYPEGSVADNGSFVASGSAVHTGQFFFDNDTLNAVAATCPLLFTSDTYPILMIFLHRPL